MLWSGMVCSTCPSTDRETTAECFLLEFLKLLYLNYFSTNSKHIFTIPPDKSTRKKLKNYTVFRKLFSLYWCLKRVSGICTGFWQFGKNILRDPFHWCDRIFTSGVISWVAAGAWAWDWWALGSWGHPFCGAWRVQREPSCGIMFQADKVQGSIHWEPHWPLEDTVLWSWGNLVPFGGSCV